MKKVLCLFLSTVLLLLMTACTTDTSTTTYYSTVESEAPTTAPTCNHEYSAATCSAPQTCKHCGITNGEKLEHNWQEATCTSPKKCKTCNETEGSISSCKNNGNGLCVYCGQDLFLNNIKNNVTVKLIIPSIGANDNYYLTVDYANNTESTIVLDCFVSGNGKLCYNSDVSDFALQSGTGLPINYYRGITTGSRYEAKYKDMYLDNSSLAYTNIDTNGKTVYVKFGVNGIVDAGYSLQDIGIY